MGKNDLLKEFKKLTKQEQLEWIESRTKEVIKRLPSLKSKLTAYDDRSDELYNLEVADIQLMSKVHMSNIARGSSGSDSSLSDYLTQLNKYARTDLRQLELETSEMRWESFMNNARANSSGEMEDEYLTALENTMSEEDKIKFTRSKLFYDSGDLSSADYVKFLEEYGIGVGTARLEVWIEQNKEGSETLRRFYSEDTSTRLGRHKKKK